MAEKSCLNCGRTIVGRTDKIFCADACRNCYHNKKRSDSNQTVRQVNYILNKNRDILKKLKSIEDDVVPKLSLIDSGFDFSYHTHVSQVAEGPVQYFCYDYGYYGINNEYFALIKRK
ncbi:MAG: hypothetical protein OEW75_15390 [Cyclobacteriaceae bacterium]|nr:hypothetical protein [Cyclobacteriaceae bacterium]